MSDPSISGPIGEPGSVTNPGPSDPPTDPDELVPLDPKPEVDLTAPPIAFGDENLLDLDALPDLASVPPSPDFEGYGKEMGKDWMKSSMIDGLLLQFRTDKERNQRKIDEFVNYDRIVEAEAEHRSEMESRQKLIEDLEIALADAPPELPSQLEMTVGESSGALLAGLFGGLDGALSGADSAAKVASNRQGVEFQNEMAAFERQQMVNRLKYERNLQALNMHQNELLQLGAEKRNLHLQRGQMKFAEEKDAQNKTFQVTMSVMQDALARNSQREALVLQSQLNHASQRFALEWEANVIEYQSKMQEWAMGAQFDYSNAAAFLESAFNQMLTTGDFQLAMNIAGGISSVMGLSGGLQTMLQQTAGSAARRNAVIQGQQDRLAEAQIEGASLGNRLTLANIGLTNARTGLVGAQTSQTNAQTERINTENEALQRGLANPEQFGMNAGISGLESYWAGSGLSANPASGQIGPPMPLEMYEQRGELPAFMRDGWFQQTSQMLSSIPSEVDPILAENYPRLREIGVELAGLRAAIAEMPKHRSENERAKVRELEAEQKVLRERLQASDNYRRFETAVNTYFGYLKDTDLPKEDREAARKTLQRLIGFRPEWKE